MRRRALRAASQPTFNGNELPTEIPMYGPPTEELKNLFSFLSGLTIYGTPVTTINKYGDRIFIEAGGYVTNLYQDGSTSSGGSGGGN